MRKCQKCSAALLENEKFCSMCGTASIADSPSTQKKTLSSNLVFWVALAAIILFSSGSIALFLTGSVGSAPQRVIEGGENDVLLHPDNEHDPEFDENTNSSFGDAGFDTDAGVFFIDEHERGSDRMQDNIVEHYDLVVVRFPPSEKVACSSCNGTLKHTCVLCEGTGLANANLADFDTSLFEFFGLYGLSDFYNNQPCFYCADGQMDCMYGVCNGLMGNPEYRNYIVGLKELYDQTGMRIFKLEDNQVSPYVSIYFCTFFGCEGTGVIQHFLDVGSLITCDACLAQGHRLEYIDSFTVEELYDDICLSLQFHDYHLNRPPPMPAPESNISGGMCLSAGCNDSRSSTSVYCTSCQAGRGAIDLGSSSTGNCIKCGGRTYTDSVHCGACR